MDQDVISADVVGMHLASPDSGGLNCADAIGRCRRMCRGPWFWRRCRPPSCDARSIAFPLRRCVYRDTASHTVTCSTLRPPRGGGVGSANLLASKPRSAHKLTNADSSQAHNAGWARCTAYPPQESPAMPKRRRVRTFAGSWCTSASSRSCR